MVDLEEAINVKRAQMIEIGMEKGLSCRETVECSQELDRLLNDYRRLTTNKRQSKSNFFQEELMNFFLNLNNLIVSPYKLLLPYKSKRIS